MKGQMILKLVAIAGFTLSSSVSALMIGSSAAVADNWRNPGQWQAQGLGQDRQFQNGNQYGGRQLPTGTIIPVSAEGRKRIVLRRSERYPLTVVVSQDIGSNRRGRAVLPRGSRIEGELVQSRRGYRFESSRVTLPNGRSERISAVSQALDQRDRFDRADRNDVNVSDGARSVLGTILGRPATSDPNILGDTFERYPNSRRDLVVVYPQRDLELRLTRDFSLNQDTRY